MMERILKIVEISKSMPASYKYPRKILRVVRCLPEQKGYKNETGIDILWESPHYNPFSKGPKSDYSRYVKKACDLFSLNRFMPDNLDE